MKKLTTFLILSAVLAQGQANVWTRAAADLGVDLSCPTLVYSPATDECIMTMGTHDESGVNYPYSVQVYTPGLGRFINALPHDSLYGDWADSTGFARNNGRVGPAVFGTYYWAFKSVEGYLRPNLGAHKEVRAYGQRALDTDNGLIYFYINNATFSYDPATRLWDTIGAAIHPNSGAAEGYLKWGSLCWDPVNHEILLFGGGAADKDSGHVGTWTFKPATGAWTRLDLTVQPPPRAHTSMTYDPQNGVIVLFGGDHLDYFFGDTWIYDCSSRSWTQRHPSMNPGPRAGAALLTLPKSGKVILAGGYSASLSPAQAYEIWTYDYASDAWGLVKRFSGNEMWPKTLAPRNHSAGFTTVDTGDAVLALGDSAPSFWYFHPALYRLSCDASVIDPVATAAYGVTRDTLQWRSDNTWEDPAWYGIGVAEPDTGANEAFLRGLGLNTWYRISQPKVPGGAYRAWSSTIFDPDRGQFLKFGGGHVAHCGTDVDHYSVHTNRYAIGFRPEYPLDWDQDNNCRPGPFTFNHRPFMNVHNTHAYDYDANLRKMVYVGGVHTHIYDPDRMDYDTNHIHSTFGGGGYNSGLIRTPHGCAAWVSNYYGFQGVYLFDASIMNWRRLGNTGLASPPGFYADNSGVTYDSRRDRLIHVQGNGGSIAAVHTFDFATGEIALVAASNSAIATGNDHYRDLVYLPNTDEIVFGIRKPEGHLSFDCGTNAWDYHPIALDASVSSAATLDDRGAGYMYDVSRNLVWVSDHSLGVFVMRPDAGLVPSETGPGGPEVSALTAAPNPFNPAVTLRLTGALKNGAWARIFDLSGRRIADLSVVNGTAVWNARAMASGVYLVTAGKKGLLLRKKIILSK